MRRFARDHPYWAGAAIYGLAISVLAVALECVFPDAPRTYFATRGLEPNHRIVAVDLRWPDRFPANLGFYLPPPSSLEGRYVRTAIEAGKPIDPAALDMQPAPVPVSSDKVLVVPLPADSGLVTLLDAGVPVLGTTQEDGAVLFSGTVHAILCDARKPDGQACRTVLRIPGSQYFKLPKDLSTLRLAVQPLVPLPQYDFF